MYITDKFKKAIFGYDIFISYSRLDSLDYAYAIARHFMRRGYECYIDQLSSVSPGENLPPNIQHAVKRSTAFVLIGSEGAQRSKPIDDEITLFLDKNKNKPLIPITVEGAIGNETIWHKKIVGLALIDDSKQNLKVGQPAPDVLERIENALRFTKKGARLRNISLSILLGIVVVSGVAAYFTYSKTKEAKEAIAEKEQADSLRVLALNEKKDAIRQMQQANKLKNHADSLKEVALDDKEKAEKLKHIADSLQLIAETKVDHLNVQSQMLQTRIAAINQLEGDPVKAYRLAEAAYNLDKSLENKELILSSLSSIDYYYKSVWENYQIVDFKEPYILLLDKQAKDKEPNLAVYEMNSSSIIKTSLHADLGWIVPDKNSWRILTRNWQGENLDAIPVYQLWSDSFKPIGNKIQGGRFASAKFINFHKLSIKLYGQYKTMIWDLLSNEKEILNENTADQVGNSYFYGIYGALDTRSDGISAGHYKDGLVLVHNGGNIDTSSYTPVEFDPSSFFTRAKWSPDGKYLALNYFDRRRLGVWDPVKRSFVWLDPDGWVVNSYSWSQNSHLLAFSGRTENDVDVTVQIIDASSPEKSRKVIYRGQIPIQSIAFLPGDENLVICDKESNMLILEIATNKVVGRGQQADLVKSSPSGFYSNSAKDFKSWSTLSAPSKNWFYKSDSIRTYQPIAASDPSFKWIAVPFFQKKDTTTAIELRNIITGEKKSLNFSGDYVHRINFSEKGAWLILETSEKIHFWNTTSWKYFDFALIQNDRQFIDLEMKSDTLYASLAEDSAGYVIDYVFHLNKTHPEFIGRSVTNKKSKDRYNSQSKDNNVEQLVKGWKMDRLYKYKAAGWSKSGEWGIRFTCRDNPLGAHDCDVLFVPTNVEWLRKVYDALLWKPSKQELQKLVLNKY